jgi:hypothetical protein
VWIRGAACNDGSDEVSLEAPNADQNVDSEIYNRQGERDIVIFEPLEDSPHAVRIRSAACRGDGDEMR